MPPAWYLGHPTEKEQFEFLYLSRTLASLPGVEKLQIEMEDNENDREIKVCEKKLKNLNLRNLRLQKEICLYM